MTAEIIAVGTELLLGDILNTNAQFLSQQMAQLGVTVHFQSVVEMCIRDRGSTYLLLESTVSAPNKSYRLRTLSDVTGVFTARGRQLARFWCMEAGALGVCALAIVLLTKRMTRPLDELYGASRRIARGDYTARAEVATQDEIGSVAESFNACLLYTSPGCGRAGGCKGGL